MKIICNSDFKKIFGATNQAKIIAKFSNYDGILKLKGTKSRQFNHATTDLLSSGVDYIDIKYRKKKIALSTIITHIPSENVHLLFQTVKNLIS